MKIAYIGFALSLMAGDCVASAENLYIDSAKRTATQDIVPFHIAPGTGDKPWNTPQKPIVASVGQTIRFYNDDDIQHFLHTPGSPCPHPEEGFEPGETFDCVVSKPHDASHHDIYDHIQGPDAQVYIQANP